MTPSDPTREALVPVVHAMYVDGTLEPTAGTTLSEIVDRIMAALPNDRATPDCGDHYIAGYIQAARARITRITDHNADVPAAREARWAVTDLDDALAALPTTPTPSLSTREQEERAKWRANKRADRNAKAADYAARVLDLWLTGDEDFTEAQVRYAIDKVRAALSQTEPRPTPSVPVETT